VDSQKITTRALPELSESNDRDSKQSDAKSSMQAQHRSQKEKLQRRTTRAATEESDRRENSDVNRESAAHAKDDGSFPRWEKGKTVSLRVIENVHSAKKTGTPNLHGKRRSGEEMKDQSRPSLAEHSTSMEEPAKGTEKQEVKPNPNQQDKVTTSPGAPKDPLEGPRPEESNLLVAGIPRRRSFSERLSSIQKVNLRNLHLLIGAAP